MELGEPDACGRRFPRTYTRLSNMTLDADMVVPAIGQKTNLVPPWKGRGIKLSTRGTHRN